MKNKIVALFVILGAVQASAMVEEAQVCSVGRQGQIHRMDIRLINDGTMDVDGLIYDVVSAREISGLKRLSQLAGEKVVDATEYVLSAPQGTNVIQLAETASGDSLMIFPDTGIIGATSHECR